MTASAACGLLLLVAGCSSTGDAAPLPETGGDSAPAQPATEVAIRQADFQVTYRLEGVTAESDRVGLISNRQLAFEPDVDDGAPVRRGDQLGRAIIAPDVEAALEAGAASSSVDEARLGQLRSLERALQAPVSGVFEVVEGRPIVSTPGIDVVVGLTPIQELRYQSILFTGRAIVETVVGERNVPCDAIWIARSAAAPEEGGESGPARLHCRLPGFVETAAGLRSRVVLESETIRDAVVVPNVFVGYDADRDGYYVQVERDGATTTIPVVVGVTDGVVRVITSDVPVGARLVPLPGE